MSSTFANLTKFLDTIGVIKNVKNTQAALAALSTPLSTAQSAVNANAAVITRLVPAPTTFSTIWDTSGAKDYGVLTISGPLALTANAAESIDGGFTQCDFITDGVNIPTLDGTPASPWPTGSGKYVQVLLMRRGANQYWRSVPASLQATLGGATPPPPPPPPAVPIAASRVLRQGAKQFTLTAPNTANTPFSIGYSFAQGDFPAGSNVTADKITNLQVHSMNTWGDGSLKFAVLSGIAALTANTAMKVTLAPGAAPSGGSTLTTANLKATGITAGMSITNSQDWTWDTAATTIGTAMGLSDALDVIETGTSTTVDGSAAPASSITVNNGAAISNVSMTKSGSTALFTATLTGGTVGQAQTVNYVMYYHVVRAFSAATKATNVRLTLTEQTGYQVGHHVQLSGFVGMTQLNGLTGVVTAVDTSNSQWIELNIDSTGFSTYVSGGQGYRVETNGNSNSQNAYVRTGGGLQWNATDQALELKPSNSLSSIATAITWSGTDWDSPFATHVTGYQMSSWIYRKPFGTDPHLVGWLEVRLYANGMVDVLPWVENGYIHTAAPTNKYGTYNFTLGGTQQFSQYLALGVRMRTVLINGTMMSYWYGGSDPQLNFRHNTDYLQSTEVVPAYLMPVPTNSVQVTNMNSSTFVPFQQGGFQYPGDGMGGTGASPGIGLLPQHDALYLTCDNPDMCNIVPRNSYSVGRYNIHERDEATNRPLRFSQHPHLSDNYSSTGDYPSFDLNQLSPGWEMSHQPSVGFLAYLLTGRFYHMEQAQFAATHNYIGFLDVQRNNASGTFEPISGGVQTREVAWTLRALLHACLVTPDSDAAGLQAEFANSLEAMADIYHGKYVEGVVNGVANTAYINTMCIIQDTVDYCSTNTDPDIDPTQLAATTGWIGASWMHDFCTAAFGWVVSAQPNINSTAATKYKDFFVNYIAQSAVLRLGSYADWQAGTAFLYTEAGVYGMAFAPQHTRSTDGFYGVVPPYFPNMRAAYDVTKIYSSFYTGSPAYLQRAFVESPDTLHQISGTNDGYFANLVPAIAAAVRHGSTGAAEAWARLTSAYGWAINDPRGDNANMLADFAAHSPVWGVKPLLNVLPTWLSSAAVGEWVTIPGTAQAGSAVDLHGGSSTSQRIAASSFALKDTELILAACGGNGLYQGNEVIGCDINSNAPAWVVRHAASSSFTADAMYEPDGQPCSAKRYFSAQWSKETGRILLPYTQSTFDTGQNGSATNGYNPTTNTWDTAGTWGAGLPQVLCSDEDGNFWAFGLDGTSLHKWVPSIDTWSTVYSGSVTISPGSMALCFDSKRKNLFSFGFDPGSSSYIANSFDRIAGTKTGITFNASTALTQWLALTPTFEAMEYDPVGDRYLIMSAASNSVFVITPNSTTVWDVSVMTVTGTPPNMSGIGVARFRYVASLGGFVCMPNATDNLSFLKTTT